MLTEKQKQKLNWNKFEVYDLLKGEGEPNIREYMNQLIAKDLEIPLQAAKNKPSVRTSIVKKVVHHFTDMDLWND